MTRKFRTIAEAFPLLGAWKDAPRVTETEAAHLDRVGITVEAPSALPAGPPQEGASTADRIARVLRERAHAGSPLAVYRGDIAAGFAAEFPHAAPVLFEAHGAPVEWLESPDLLPNAAGEPSIADVYRATVLWGADWSAVTVHSRRLRMQAHERRVDGGDTLWWAPVEHAWELEPGWRVELEGALVFEEDRLRCERGHHDPGDPLTAPHSWLVVRARSLDGEWHDAVRIGGAQMQKLMKRS